MELSSVVKNGLIESMKKFIDIEKSYIKTSKEIEKIGNCDNYIYSSRIFANYDRKEIDSIMQYADIKRLYISNGIYEELYITFIRDILRIIKKFDFMVDEYDIIELLSNFITKEYNTYICPSIWEHINYLSDIGKKGGLINLTKHNVEKTINYMKNKNYDSQIIYIMWKLCHPFYKTEINNFNQKLFMILLIEWYNQRYNNVHNIGSPIGQLPTEIMTHIFGFILY